MGSPRRAPSASSPRSIHVLALTSFKDETLVQSALQAGAIGYLLKDVSADELAQAIRAAHAGRATLSPEAAQALVHAASQSPPPGLDLTERERAVLALMVEGLNNTQIATKLTVSPSTIKSHVSNILTKLGAASRTEAVTLALRNATGRLSLCSLPQVAEETLPGRWMWPGSV